MSLSDNYDAAITSKIVARFDSRPELLIQILHGVVERFGFVPEAAVRQLADELNLSRADVHGVVSYYHDFRTEPPGKYVVKICQAEACQAMGSRALTRHAEETLGVKLHGRSDDVSLEPIYCLGNCACSPAIMIDDRVYGRVSDTRFDELIGSLGVDH
ncbi:MAG: formate dehydrogenase subunit gamma [Gammaproteobacteria bacterium]|nr:formate dehydrogenase subunit gamma [Gammaproteobacteria bacterium]